MIRIPQNKTFTQSNNQYFGDIFYSKNIDLDEEGKIKLSPRAVLLRTEEGASAFNIPLAIGVRNSGQFFIATAENPWTATINDGGGITDGRDEDNDADSPPNLTTDSHGVWWQGRWYTTEDDDLYYKTASNGNWTDVNISAAMTSGVRHPLCVFRNKNSLAIGNGNQVLLYNTSHSLTVTLTIPSDFEVTSLAYNNNRLAIGTKPSVDAAGQNGEAFLFLWDGAGTTANAGFAVGSNFIYDVAPYQSSFVVLTQSGTILYFNGGGFTELPNLPVFFTQRTWGDNSTGQCIGDVLYPETNVVHMNINGSTERFGRKGEEYLHNSPGGIWTLDPRLGLYHRISPSISPVSRLTVQTSGVNTTTDVLTVSAGTIPTTGSPMKYVHNDSDKIGGLSIGQVYYCIKIDASTFKLATSKANADLGTAIDLTAAAAGDSYFLAFEFKDYGQSYNTQSGGMAMSEQVDLALDNFIFGGFYLDANSTTSYAGLCFTARGFTNIGYIVTSKAFSRNVMDAWQKVYIKHNRLRSGESIQVKYQTKELPDLPVTTPQHGAHCTWTDANTFTTTADLSEAKTYLDAGVALECEIIGGAGAGQMSQITSITFSTGTYTVNLDDNLEGITASDICDVKIENWDVTNTASDTDTDYTVFSFGTKSPAIRLKVIMKGVDVAIEEMQLINSAFKPST